MLLTCVVGIKCVYNGRPFSQTSQRALLLIVSFTNQREKQTEDCKFPPETIVEDIREQSARQRGWERAPWTGPVALASSVVSFLGSVSVAKEFPKVHIREMWS